MELYEDLFQNDLFFSRSKLAWAHPPIFSAAIIMIFVSGTNINEYVRNYQDCLTLGMSLNFFVKSQHFSKETGWLENILQV
jgi:hypothetical protein